MESAIFDRTLRALCRRVPFQHFTVELTSGTRFQVEQPGTVAFNNGSAGHIAPDGTPILFNHRDVIQFIAGADAASASLT